MKVLALEELRESGLLQEANRQFFHPLGLALSVCIDEDLNEALEILDGRDDREGFIFAEGVMARESCDRFRIFMVNRHQIREQALGFVIQPEP